MTVRVTVLAVVMILSVCVRGAGAQGAYVSAAVLADIVRSTHSDYPGAPESGGGGEAIGFALRAGTPLGANWGVEVEFVRPGEIEDELDAGVLGSFVQSAIYQVRPEVVRQGVDSIVITDIPRPGFSYRVRSTERNSTLSAALWLQQQFTSRFSMVYLGGVAFLRSELESEVTYAPLILTPSLPSPLILPPTRTDTTFYGVQPMVGVESRIAMTEQVHLVPGLRMHASDGRWLLRPSVGISWTF